MYFTTICNRGIKFIESKKIQKNFFKNFVEELILSSSKDE